MKHVFCLAVVSFSCLLEAALFSNSSHSIPKGYGDSELPSRTTASPSGTVNGPASVLSSIEGPSMWAISYTWSKYLTPTVVGTVRITFNEATNQTAATTIFHSEYKTNGSMEILTRTNVNAAGTQTGTMDLGFGKSITVAYPTPFFDLYSEMYWTAILPTVQNASVTCCWPQTTSSPTPTHAPFTTADAPVDTADPRGWLYTLQGFNDGDADLPLTGAELSSYWPNQPLTLAYTGCAHDMCPPTPSYVVDPMAFASSGAFLLESTTITVSSATEKDSKVASKTANDRTRTKAQATSTRMQDPSNTSAGDMTDRVSAADTDTFTAKPSQFTITSRPITQDIGQPGDSAAHNTAAVRESALDASLPTQGPSQLSITSPQQTSDVQAQPAKATNQEQPIGWFVRESNVDPAPSHSPDPKPTDIAHTGGVDDTEEAPASKKAFETSPGVAPERTSALPSPSVLVDPIAATRASSRISDPGSEPTFEAAQRPQVSTEAMPTADGHRPAESVLVDPVDATQPYFDAPTPSLEPASSTQNIGGYIWRGIDGTTAASSVFNAGSQSSSSSRSEPPRTSSFAAQQTTSGAGSRKSQLGWMFSAVAGNFWALVLL